MTVALGFLVAVVLNQVAGKPPLPTVVRQLVLDITLTRNFFRTGLFGFPNASLWFIPLLVGLYAAFPLLWSGLRRWGWAKVLVVAVLCELTWRAVAVFLLDGVPVATGKGVFPFVLRPWPALDRLPDSFAFQQSAPFAVFPARIGEFALGVAAGSLASAQGVPSLWGRRRKPLLAGAAVVWLTGSVAVSLGPVGWIFSDLLIALGGTALAVAAAGGVRRRWPDRFASGSRRAEQTFAVYLAHMVFFELVVGLVGVGPFHGPIGGGFLVAGALALMIGTVRGLVWIDRRIALRRQDPPPG